MGFISHRQFDIRVVWALQCMWDSVVCVVRCAVCAVVWCGVVWGGVVCGRGGIGGIGEGRRDHEIGVCVGVER